MTRLTGYRFGIVLALVGLPSLARASDTLLVNGNIYTGNPSAKWAQAIAITGSRIDAVGTNDEIMKRREPRSQVIDLQRRIVIPGIIDSHTHMWLGALALHGFNLATPEIYIDATEPEALVAAIKAYAAKNPREPVLYGRVQFTPGDVSHTLLDTAVSDRPIVIHAPTEHTLWVNGRMLQMAGITAKKYDDPAIESFVLRDKAGRPTGVLREAAMSLVERALGKQPLSTRMTWMREATRHMNRYGITSVTNATGSTDELALYAAMRDRGELTVRTKTAFGVVGVNHVYEPQFFDELEKARATYNDRWVSSNMVKLFSDGAGTGALYKPEDFKKLVFELDKRGFQVITHALGPEPARMVLDTYEEVANVNGPRDRRFRVEHAIRLSIADLNRLGKLGVVASMQPDLCCFVDAPGVKTNTWQTFLTSGATLAFGSDWPCIFPADPFSGMQQAVTRAQRQLFSRPNPIANPPLLSPEERLTIEQAVDAYTRGGAYGRFAEDYLGTLEAGKEADLAVLTQDIFTIPAEKISGTQAVLTMVGGRIVFNEMR
jgi:predicted amidohydrolase YtcJ